MKVVSHCAWCKKRYPSTVPELCEDLRVAIEAGDEHNALIMAFAAELALFQESWPYCSRKCENEDADCPDGHPDRHGLEDTLGSIEALPWKYIRAKAQGVELPAPTPPPRLVGLGPDDPAPDFLEDSPAASEPRTAPDLKLVNRLEEAESQAQELVNQRRLRAERRVRRDQKPRLGLWTFGIFTVGFFAGSLLMHLWGVALGDALLTVSGSTMIIGGLLGIIAALLAIRNR